MYAVGVLIVLLARDCVELRSARDLDASSGSMRTRARSLPAQLAPGIIAMRSHLPGADGADLAARRAACCLGLPGGATRTLPALWRASRLASPPIDPVHLGPGHRRGDLLRSRPTFCRC